MICASINKKVADLFKKGIFEMEEYLICVEIEKLLLSYKKTYGLFGTINQAKS